MAKNRNGPDGIDYPIKMDTSNVFIEVLEETEEERVIVNTAKDQKKLLAEKYKNFKNKGEL